MKFELFIDEEYERAMVKDYALQPSKFGKELGPLGVYTPVSEIFSLGWDKWKEEAYADFVIKLIDWHNGLYQDHASEPFFPALAPLIAKGELSKEELKTFYKHQMATTSQVFEFEGIAAVRAHIARANDIRDMIKRHYFEETGHNDMLADFVAGAFNMDKISEVYPLTDPRNFNKIQSDMYRSFWSRNAHGHFVELAAASMLMERWIPKPHRQMAIGLRKHYGISNTLMTFFDVHSYIDIYHERFGAYILAKYANTKELRDIAENAFKASINGYYKAWKSVYESMPIHKR
jgi:pyrroloquinoline quinone (PQQ) biosynthesis protein C